MEVSKRPVRSNAPCRRRIPEACQHHGTQSRIQNTYRMGAHLRRCVCWDCGVREITAGSRPICTPVFSTVSLYELKGGRVDERGRWWVRARQDMTCVSISGST